MGETGSRGGEEKFPGKETCTQQMHFLPSRHRYPRHASVKIDVADDGTAPLGCLAMRNEGQTPDRAAAQSSSSTFQ
jgi:hypothetical protein